MNGQSEAMVGVVEIMSAEALSTEGESRGVYFAVFIVSSEVNARVLGHLSSGDFRAFSGRQRRVDFNTFSLNDMRS